MAEVRQLVSNFLLSTTAAKRLFRATMALAGVAAAIGSLVVLRHLQIPFFVYYPRTTSTVLVSDTLDMCLFLAGTVCVPASFLIFTLQSRTRRQPARFIQPILVSAVAAWLTSVALMTRAPSWAALTLFALTLTAAAINLSICGRVYGLELRNVLSDMLVPALTVFGLIELAPMYYWMISSINPGSAVGRAAAELELNLTYALHPLAPYVFVGLLFSWLWTPVAFRLFPKPKPPETVERCSRGPGRFLDRRSLVASIDLIAILSIVVFYYPYFAGQDWIVGVDSYMNYYDPLVRISGLGLTEALPVLASTFHGAYVGLLFIAQLATGLDPFVIVKFAPLVLVFLTPLVIFWTFKSTGEYDLAMLSALCCILWIPTTLGIFGGLQANWTAFALWMIFLALMLTGAKTGIKRPVRFAVQAIVSAGILLIHPWTWGVFLSTLIILTILLRLQKSPAARTSATGLFLALVLAVPVGVASMSLFPGIRKDALNTLMMYLWTLSSPIRLLSDWSALLSMLIDWSSFLSPVLLMIAVLGATVLLRRKDLLGKYLFAWILAWCVGSILVAPIGYYPDRPGISETALWRMLYISPLPILLAFGVESIINLSRHLEGTNAMPLSVTLQKLIAVVGPVALCSALIVASSSPITRLVGTLAVLLAVVLLMRFVPTNQMARILIVTVVVLVILNGAFRSLYPLLLDPHNLFR